MHSWGWTLEYHPHAHYVVPGGAISEDRAKWLASRADFFIPVKAASLIYRAKFCDEMRKAGLLNQIPASVWREAWVGHSKPVGDGRRSLQYLAPYVFRVAISDRWCAPRSESRSTSAALRIDQRLISAHVAVHSTPSAPRWAILATPSALY